MNADHVVAVALMNVAVDGRYNLSHLKGWGNILELESLSQFGEFGFFNFDKYDIGEDDSINYSKMLGDYNRNMWEYEEQQEEKKKRRHGWYYNSGGSSGSGSDDYDASDHDDEGYYDDYSSDFSSQAAPFLALKSELINGYVGDFAKEEREEMDDILEGCVEFVSTEFIPESAAETHDMTMWLSKEFNANRSSVMKVENMFRKGISGRIQEGRSLCFFLSSMQFLRNCRAQGTF